MMTIHHFVDDNLKSVRILVNMFLMYQSKLIYYQAR